MTFAEYLTAADLIRRLRCSPPDLIKHIRDVADEHAVSGEQLHTFFVERVDALQMPIATEKLWKVVDLALTGSIELKDQPACDTKIRLLLHG